ncbi:LysR family transcriptional regulator [Aliidiomarina sedimenti]|uniref:LysR family transcriptional regulator n=1 Tax=Aliidiomarina sedimenti TaxID=1933879 RepID=A0ABY0C114_9GAMM|nr:LysR family transcriptional regulator [Aliidiomarina sedimenti]RUO31499.1 LysR family transcriptional regulator [Aliidiomarina sedimenti]
MDFNQQRFNHLDLNLLRVLREIYLQRQLNLAADQLALSPSALSHALRRLRDHFQDPLFERHGRQLVPTPYCEHLAPVVIQHLLALQQLIATPQLFDPQTAQLTFTIGMPEAMESSLLPRLHHLVQQLAPHCRLRSVPYMRDHLTDSLTRRTLDLIVDVEMAIPRPVCHAPFMQDHFVVLSRKPVQLETMQQYLSHPHIAVSGRPQGIVLEDMPLLKAGFERTIELRCQSYQSAAQIAAGSELLLTVPDLIGAPLAQQYPLHQAPLPLTSTEIQLRVYWHQQDNDDQANRWLRHNLIQLGDAGKRICA